MEMTDQEYLNLAEALLQRVELDCDSINAKSDVDIDTQRVGGMVTLTFANGSQIVINLQKPLHEVWMAAKAGGYHYRWGRDHWLDTKSGVEFFEELSRQASLQCGVSLTFGSSSVLE